MKSFLFLSLIAATLLGLMACDMSKPEDTVSTKPNVLLILVDDLGSNDLSLNNQQRPNLTPSIDAFAQQATYYNRFYTDSTCAASRASLLTGLHPARLGFRPVGRGISPQTPTLAKTLQQAGYETYHVGKWHVGEHTPTSWPNALGFTHSFGFLNQWFLQGKKANGDYQNPHPTYYDPWLQTNRQLPEQYKGHLTNILADHTIDVITQNSRAKKPWFIYHATLAPHTPYQPPKDSKATTKEEQYAALVKNLDTQIGRIIQSLKDTQQMDNTLIIIASDNGGTNMAWDNNFPYQGKKAQYDEGGVRVPLFIHLPKQSTAAVNQNTVAIIDLYPTIIDLLGLTAPTPLDGISINSLPKKRPLFWSTISEFSLLTDDHRWRWTASFNRDGKPYAGMFDLASNSIDQRNTNVIATQQKLSNTLQTTFVEWFFSSSKIATSYHPEQQQLTGDDIQRSPVSRGWTLALGVTAKSSDTGPLAEQQGFFTVDLNNTHLKDKNLQQGLSATINGITLNADFTKDNQCHLVLLTGEFYDRFDSITQQAPPSKVQLLIDGKIVAEKTAVIDRLPNHNFANPTLIGTNHKGQQFSGALSEPVIVNMVLSPNIQYPLIQLQQQLCPNNS